MGYARVRTLAWPAAPRFFMVGDSIMHTAGWRALLFQALTAAGYNPDFRGTVVNATDSPPLDLSVAGHSHSGLNGASGSQWYATYWDNNGGASQFPSAFPTEADYPQIICLAVGANDLRTAPAATDYCRLIDKALTAVPTAHVLMATTTRIAGNPTAHDAQANQVRAEVAARRAAGKNVSLVDANAVVLEQGDWTDGLHLTDSGNRKVAFQAWIPATTALLEGRR